MFESHSTRLELENEWLLLKIFSKIFEYFQINIRKIQSIDPIFEVGEPYDEQNLVGKRVTLLLEYETYKENTSLRPKFKSKNFGYIADNDVAF